ncbi:1,4-dihydroxy-2-naphthoate polyprenyltransferase [Bacillus tuaregi]|uniref:1,4-dihydroxy-2-naphthoate polyprenyltransferase n=1 Tax=Bacillus tuaregi TaxID=1816695 RepID=UPI0008F91341|nr:1,4-dihydroxy-2-naphthoate polyprenyltransferase [Bacillus tuaregi]
MSLRTFLKLIEIQTKVASLFPFLVGLLFVMYRFESIKPINTIIFFSSMLIFDLTTTAINNYMDYKKATTDEYRKRENIIGQANISVSLVRNTIITMLLLAIGLGIWLVFRTDLLVLLLGILCFIIGVFYTYGPVPISRMPLGEVFSGVTMGFGILFLVVYVNAYDQGIANLFINGYTLSFEANLALLGEVIWVSLPCIFTIANIMLANNICDLEDDIKNFRFTLPYYIGKKSAIVLYNVLYVATFVSILTAVIFDVLPTIMLLSLFIIIPVSKHISLFNKKQIKSETFHLAIKNLVLVNGSIITMMVVSFIV